MKHHAPEEFAIARVALVEAFQARCEARAILCACGELDLHEAVDVLQESAGTLIEVIGQDAVQEIMHHAFCPSDSKTDIWPPPNWSEYGPQKTWRRVSHDAPESTIEAFKQSIRDDGVAAIETAANKERFWRMSKSQRKQIREWITKWIAAHG
jgi:hypothetical protein